MKRSVEQGFTLIELLIVISTLGVLAALSITSLKIYRSNAAYGVASKTLRDARTSLEAGLIENETAPAAVPLTAQTSQGPIQAAAANALLPAMQLPRNLKFQVMYDPTCTAGGCISDMLQVDHCHSLEYTRWTRFGDGVEIQLDHVAGSNCT